jgi:transposase
MPKPCSLDLRIRVPREVEAGASRREAAECVEVSASSAIKWMQRLNEAGSITAKPSGRSISPLEAPAAVMLGLIAGQPDLTLDEIVAVIHNRQIAGSRSAVWRSLKRHNVSFKKEPARGRAAASARGPRPAALDARARHV